jgi:L-iditol 2-dehydrogenase
MLVARLVGKKKFDLVEDPEPILGDNDILIRMNRVGVCGSDMHAYLGCHPFVHPPRVLGHEVAGSVEKMGSGVTGFELGEKITIEPNVVCGECVNCRSGRYNICQSLAVIGCVGYDGGYGQFMVCPADKAIKVPANWTPEQTAFVEPLAVGVHAVRLSSLKVGDSVVVIGGGVIGLLTAATARANGATRVVLSESVGYRRELAAKFGVTDTLDPAEGNVADRAIELLKDVDGPDIVFDCVGIQPTWDDALAIGGIRKGIQIIMVGVPEKPLTVDMSIIQDRELELIGSLMYVRKDFKGAIDLIDSGMIDPAPLATHTFPLAETTAALDMALSKTDNAMKVLIDCT